MVIKIFTVYMITLRAFFLFESEFEFSFKVQSAVMVMLSQLLNLLILFLVRLSPLLGSPVLVHKHVLLSVTKTAQLESVVEEDDHKNDVMINLHESYPSRHTTSK